MYAGPRTVENYHLIAFKFVHLPYFPDNETPIPVNIKKDSKINGIVYQLLLPPINSKRTKPRVPILTKLAIKEFRFSFGVGPYI